MFIYKSISSILRSSSKCQLKIRGYSCIPSDSLKKYNPIDHNDNNNDDDDDDDDKKKGKRLLKKWRKEEEKKNDPIASMLDFSETFDDQMYKKKMPSKPSEFGKWYREQQIDYIKWSQRYIAERQATLGKDLAISQYIVYRGGRIRRKGHNEFIDDFDKLPTSFNPLWLVEEIDASKIELYYEALDNFKDLNRLKIVSFCHNPNFNDWCLERILVLCPNIEKLDVSDCKNVTERGLEGIYRYLNLKNLVITDFNNTAAFELTVMLLEDSRPDLKITVKQPTINKIEKKQDKK